MESQKQRPIVPQRLADTLQSMGKSERYGMALKKYEQFQNKQDKIQEMDNILTVPHPLDANRIQGKQKETIIPKAGEFMIVSTDKKIDPSDELSIGLEELLDVRQKSLLFQECQIDHPTKDRLWKEIVQRQGRLDPTRPVSDVKRVLPKVPGRPSQRRQPARLYFQRISFEIQTQQPQRRFKLKQGGKQQSMHQMNLQQMAQRVDISQGLASHRQYEDSQHTQSKIFNPQVCEKQKTLVNNPDMKTSMTTSIRNIMRKQDKDMMTSSSRLLHSQLEAFDEQMKARQENLEETREGKQTVEILQSHQMGQSNQNFLPSLNKSAVGQSIDQSQIAHSVSQKNVGLVRPGSAYVLFGGEKEVLKQAKSRINLKQSRERDIINPVNHSYKPHHQKYQLEKVRNPNLASNVKTPSLPALVSMQQQMLKEQDSTSPFMREKDLQPIIIKEENPRVVCSAEYEELYRQFDEKMKSRDASPMKYTNSIEQLNSLRQDSYSHEKKGSHSKMVKMNKLIQKKQAGLTEQQIKLINKQFLPIDAYDPMIDQEDPVSVIEQNRDPLTGKTMGRSKWFFANGEFEMRPCEVLEYLEAEEQYEVKWTVNEGMKKVSRFNLIFDKEDENEFQKRIEEAKQH